MERDKQTNKNRCFSSLLISTKLCVRIEDVRSISRPNFLDPTHSIVLGAQQFGENCPIAVFLFITTLFYVLNPTKIKILTYTYTLQGIKPENFMNTEQYNTIQYNTFLPREHMRGRSCES